jgi:aspartate oxidase
MMEALVQDAPLRLEELVRWGLKGVMEKGQLYAMGPPPVWGREIIRCLRDRAAGVGVRFLSGLTVAWIGAGERGAGCLCFSAHRGEWLGFSARSLLLATGGAGAWYSRNDNPQRMLGEGYSLALEAGAALRDLEFFQFIPIATAVAGLPQFAVPSTIANKGPLINGKSEELLDKYAISERPADIHARDQLARALMSEILAGEKVYLDLRKVSAQVWQEDPLGTAEVLLRQFHADREPLRVMPTAHFFMGGVCTDAYGRTEVPGLFAAGEVAGGLHGANRMAGNALTEALVFGARAGEAAVCWAGGRKVPEDVDLPVNPIPFGRVDREPDLNRPMALKKQLQKTLWEQGGIIRNREGLTKAIGLIEEIREEALRLPDKAAPLEVQRRIELYLGAKGALLLLQAAFQREESRGAHFREDFPRQNDHHWRGHLEVALVGGKPVWSFRPS